MNCKVAEQIFEIIHLLDEEKKQPKDYGTGIPLYHAEAIFLDTLARYPGENVSSLSARLDITKGAVTKLSGKLLSKGLIEITRRDDNKKEKYVCLTALGRQTVLGHQQFHQHANQKLCDYISTLNYEETTLIFQFLNHLKECVPFCEFQCGCSRDKKEVTEYESTDTAQCVQLTSNPGNRK